MRRPYTKKSIIEKRFMPIGDETQWKWQSTDYTDDEELEFEPFERAGELQSDDTMISSISILPDDIWAKIFSVLPVASIIRAGSVCKHWHEVVHSGMIKMPPQKPWYFMFTHNRNIVGYSYDSSIRTWYSFDLLYLDKRNWFISSSCGLVCFMEYVKQNRIFVCNPITRDWKQLPKPPNEESSDHSALALSVDRFSWDFIVAVVKSKPVPGDFHQWDCTFQIYESRRCHWAESINETLVGWRGGDESVICVGILYCLVHSVLGNNERRHGVVKLNLHSYSSYNSLMETMIMAPYPLTCARLINLRDRLVLVGGIGSIEKPDVLKGIGIWELHDEEWEEVARISRKFLKGFGRFDDVFASSGAEDLIFIHSYSFPTLVTFDMIERQWKRTMRCPVEKEYSLQLFRGFCFEPGIEIKP